MATNNIEVSQVPPEYITDESSGIQVKNNDYIWYMKGRKEGGNEIIKWIDGLSLLLIRFDGAGSYTEVPLSATVEWKNKLNELDIE